MNVIAPSLLPTSDGHAPTLKRPPLGPEIAMAPLASVVSAVRSGAAHTRPELLEATGLSRKVVTQRVEQACALGLLEQGELAPSGGGRQARTVRFRPRAGHVVGVQVGASEFTVGLADLNGELHEISHEDWAIDVGPQRTMTRIRDHIERLLRRHNTDRPWGITVGLPGPVEFSTGTLNFPPIMPGWNGFAARHWLREYYDAPVWVENDVNLMAIGEWTCADDVRGRDMLFVKVGTGIGTGYISHGRIVRGQNGAAGDIGHIQVGENAHHCRCGRTGCLEAVASGWALLRDVEARRNESPLLNKRLSQRGRLVLGDIGEAVASGDQLALELTTRSSLLIAETVANLINFTNPGLVVIGGGVLRTGGLMLNNLRSVVSERCTDLATMDLEIRPASLAHREGARGAALMTAENLFSPSALLRWADAGSPLGRASDAQRTADAFA